MFEEGWGRLGKFWRIFGGILYVALEWGKGWGDEAFVRIGRGGGLLEFFSGEGRGWVEFREG